MKTQLIVFFVALFLISATTIETLSKRSTAQVVLHGTDLNELTNSINTYYKQGYRITATQSQSVATSITYYYGSRGNRDIQGEILVIMEK